MATVSSVLSRDSLPVSLSLYSWKSRERTSGVAARHPALMLPTGDGLEPASVFVPVGVAARAASTRLFEPQANAPNAQLSIALETCIARGSDHERWRLKNQPV